MTTGRIAIAALCFCGAVLGQVSVAEGIPGKPVVELDEPTISRLETLLALSQHQISRLEQINLDLQDELFPLYLDFFQKFWELGKANRTEEPDLATIALLFQTIEELGTQTQDKIFESRAKARELLTSPQLIVLEGLEDAVDLLGAAKEAVELNLIDGPEDGLWPCEPSGLGINNLFGGLLHDFPLAGDVTGLAGGGAGGPN